MKLTLKGTISDQDLAKAFRDTLFVLGFDPSQHQVRGATLFFNIYDRTTGHMHELEYNGRVADDVLWLPANVPVSQQKVLARRAGPEAVVIRPHSE